MKRLYFIRHGETEWNKLNRIQGCSDVELNNTGVWQAERIAYRLKDEKFDLILSSNLKRAYDTAKKIIQYHPNAEFKTNDLIREIEFGSWEGLTIDQLKDNYLEQYKIWRENPEIAIFPGERSLSNVKKRVEEFINTIMKIDKKRIAIVTHGGIIKLSVIILLELDLSFYKKCWFGNTSLTIIDIKDNKRIISVLNDMSHLHLEQMKPLL
ncbi:histidine phosphatase family protein [Caldicellulosiruptoraceae bacterium PP1]